MASFLYSSARSKAPLPPLESLAEGCGGGRGGDGGGRGLTGSPAPARRPPCRRWTPSRKAAAEGDNLTTIAPQKNTELQIYMQMNSLTKQPVSSYHN